MDHKYLVLDDPLYEYILELSLRESPLLRRLREETAKMPESLMQISPDQGQFMSLLVKVAGARKALEVGVFTGYSSICIASALPPEGRLTACDNNRQWTDIARRYWKEAGLDQKIDLRLGPAAETLSGLLERGGGGDFDFIFIDADKENYAEYFELAYRLGKSGALILVDNTLWEGKVIDPEVVDANTEAIRKFNRKLSRDERIDLSLLPISDGITVARKK